MRRKVTLRTSSLPPAASNGGKLTNPRMHPAKRANPLTDFIDRLRATHSRASMGQLFRLLGSNKHVESSAVFFSPCRWHHMAPTARPQVSGLFCQARTFTSGADSAGNLRQSRDWHAAAAVLGQGRIPAHHSGVAIAESESQRAPRGLLNITGNIVRRRRWKLAVLQQ